MFSVPTHFLARRRCRLALLGCFALMCLGCGEDADAPGAPAPSTEAGPDSEADALTSDGQALDAGADAVEDISQEDVVLPDADASQPGEAGHDADASQDADASPPACPNGPGECFTRKYMLLVYDPILESQGGKGLVEYRQWNSPDTLSQQYAADVLEVSHGNLRYDKAVELTVDGYPVKEDGFQYDDTSFLACLSDITKCHKPGQADGVGYAIDYPAMLAAHGVCDKLNAGEIDELWVFGAPFMGMWEANQAGTGAIWTNGPVVQGTTCQRPLNIMGFSYERGVAEMLEDLGHRSEGTLGNVFGNTGSWSVFTRYDKTTPGGAHCGNVHWAPNSDADYDWGNAKQVTSYCDNWLDYPNVGTLAKSITCSEWSCDAREHKRWWMRHFPHVAGTSADGTRNNWWVYIAGE